MRLALSRDGLLDQHELGSFVREKREQLRRGVAAGLQEGGEALLLPLRAQLQQALNTRNPGLAKSVRAVVYARDDRSPVLYLGSAVRWLGIHEHGGTVQGPLLIPLGRTRMAPQKFRELVTSLLKTKRAFFKQVNGKVLLFARQAGRNVAPVPIAVLVPNVKIRKRLRFEETVVSRMDDLADAVERGIERSANAP